MQYLTYIYCSIPGLSKYMYQRLKQGLITFTFVCQQCQNASRSEDESRADITVADIVDVSAVSDTSSASRATRTVLVMPQGPQFESTRLSQDDNATLDELSTTTRYVVLYNDVFIQF